jgi:hypothetical protein
MKSDILGPPKKEYVSAFYCGLEHLSSDWLTNVLFQGKIAVRQIDDMDETNALVPLKKRKISLTKTEREELKLHKQIELAVSLFLDLEQDRTVAQIAQEMDMSVSSLKSDTISEFQIIMSETSVGHHLTGAASNSRTSAQGMSGTGTPAQSRTAHTAQGRLSSCYSNPGVGQEPVEEDPNLLANFLKQSGVKVEGDLVINANLPIPDEYKSAFARLMGGDVITVVPTDAGTDTNDQAPDTANTGAAASPETFPTSETPASPPPDGSG